MSMYVSVENIVLPALAYVLLIKQLGLISGGLYKLVYNFFKLI